MKHSDKNFDRIEDYLFGRMSEAEKKAVEDEMAENKELAADLALHKLEHRAMELLAQQELKANLDSWKEERSGAGQQEAKVVSLAARRRFLQYAAAACALLLAGFFVWFWLGKGPDDAALASRYFDETSITNRSNTSGLPATLLPALQALQNKEYDRAVDLLGNITDSNFVTSARLLQGEAYFLKKDYSEAVTSFQSVIRQGEPILDVHEAEWRLALTYLALGYKGPEFTDLLNRISNDREHSHYPNAVALKEALAK